MILIKAGLKHTEIKIETAKEFVKLFKELPNYFNEKLFEMYRDTIKNAN
jgi:hypothetical protein